MSYTPAVLTGHFEKLDGSPAQGWVKVFPNSRGVIDGAGNVVLAGTQTATLDSSGEFTMSLPPTDDATLEPAENRQYTVAVNLKHSGSALKTLEGITLAGGTTTDYADLISGVEAVATYSAFLTQEQYDALVARVDDLEQNGGGGGGAVASVNGETGVVVLDAADVGAKPSTYAPAWSEVTGKPSIPDSPDDIGAEAIGVAAGLVAAHIAATDPHGDRAWTTTQINALIGGAPGLLDTLGEIAAQLATDESAVGALTTAVNARLVAASNLSDLTSPSAARTNLGLGNVNNTSDVNKPVSTAQAAADTAVQTAAATDATNKVATETTRATAAEAPVAYTGTFKGVWVGNTAYSVGDVLMVNSGVKKANTAHTSNSAGYQFDREKWDDIPLPGLNAGAQIPIRELPFILPVAGTTPKFGLAARRPKQFNTRNEKLLASFQSPSDVTISGAAGSSAVAGTQPGGSLVLTSPSTAAEGYFRIAPFATALDISNGQLRMPANISAVTGNYLIVDVTSAVGGTDFTNYTRFTLVQGSLDADRTGLWHGTGSPTTEGANTGTGATLTAVTGARVVLYRSTAQYTVEVSRLTFLPNVATIGKCILWLDDGNFASQAVAIKTAAKYNLPVALAPIAAMMVNGSAGLTADQTRYVQNHLRGQVCLHAFGDVDHNRAQAGDTLAQQLLDYHAFAQAAGLHGVEDGAYWSTGFQGPSTAELELTVQKMFRSMRGGKSRLVESLPPADPMNTRAMMTGGSDTSTGTWQPYITRAATAKGLAQLVWHDMTGSIPTEFATLCAWLDANRATIEVTTPAGAYDPLCV